MATNSEKDLHSVYIDNELPPAYIEKYESLVKSDATKAAELASMQKLHDAFQEDATAIERKLDDAFLEASFARLQTKMNYHRHTTAAQQVRTVDFSARTSQVARWGISFAAAAAVFALIITPLYLRSTAHSEQHVVSAIAHTKLKPIAQNNIAVDGNLNTTKLASFAESTADSTVVRGATPVSADAALRRTRNIPAYARGAKSVPFDTIASAGTIELNDSLTSIDVFRPASAADGGFSIRISVEPLSAVQTENEIIIPLPHFAGAAQAK